MNFQTKQYQKNLTEKMDKYFSLYSDSCKKIALKTAWWNTKFVFSKLKKQKPSFNDTVEHIGVFIAGGIGDLVCAAKYIQALSGYLSPQAEIDVIGETQDIETLKHIFLNKKYIHNIISEQKIPQYDLHIRLVRFPVIENYYEHRLSAHTLAYIQRINEFHKQNPLLIKNDFLGRCYSQMQGRTRETQADIDNLLSMKDVDFSIEYKKTDILARYNLESNKYITLQTGSGTHFQNIPHEVRQWPIEHYEALVNGLKERYPAYKMVQIGKSNQERIKNIDIDLRGKTDMDDLLGLLQSAKLHISQEGGIPILRHVLKGGPSVVLFGPTDEKFFGYEENINITARTCPHPCEWLTKDWMKKCLRTNYQQPCMQDIKPKDVLSQIKRVINNE